VHQEFSAAPERGREHLDRAMPRNRFGLLNRPVEPPRRVALDAIRLATLTCAPLSAAASRIVGEVETPAPYNRTVRFLILNGPTATLTRRENSPYCSTSSPASATPKSPSFVTHYLDEVFAICGRVCVFQQRDDHHQASTPRRKTSCTSMVGRVWRPDGWLTTATRIPAMLRCRSKVCASPLT
jgi:ABC-type sugar transport system ATPase subunit